jgi:hypothetical protein
MTTKRKTASAFDASVGPGLARLRKAKNAVAIREATLADQKRARRKARAEKAPGKQIGSIWVALKQRSGGLPRAL